MQNRYHRYSSSSSHHYPGRRGQQEQGELLRDEVVYGDSQDLYFQEVHDEDEENDEEEGMNSLNNFYQFQDAFNFKDLKQTNSKVRNLRLLYFNLYFFS
jgi:hypothetical protein